MGEPPKRVRRFSPSPEDMARGMERAMSGLARTVESQVHLPGFVEKRSFVRETS